MTIQFILTKQANGSYAALLNSPDTGAIKNIPATGVRFAGGILTIDVASLSGSYSGTVGKGTITGELKQEGSVKLNGNKLDGTLKLKDLNLPVSLTKE
jgi:hypothetical protein